MSNTNDYKHKEWILVIDFHMHSTFSEDCDTPMEDTIVSAIQKGFKEICFTEHLDYDYPDPEFTFDLDLPAYEKQIRSLQAKYQDKIKIRKGIEVGVQPHVLEDYEKVLTEETFDFIICSLHVSDKKDLHNGDFFKGRTIEVAHEYFYQDLLYCVKNFKSYSILGHLDLVKRYKTLDVNRDFHEIIREIFKVIIPEGKGIEINTSGYRYGLTHHLPSPDILKLYYDMGGEIITLGSDSHVASTVGRHFDECIALLKEIGFNYISSFEAQKPIFHKI